MIQSGQVRSGAQTVPHVCGHAKASKGTLQKVRRAADRQAGEERNQVKDERGRFGNHMAELLVLHSAALRSHQGEGGGRGRQ